MKTDNEINFKSGTFPESFFFSPKLQPLWHSAMEVRVSKWSQIFQNSVMNLFLSIYMAFNMISRRKVVRNNPLYLVRNVLAISFWTN